MVSAPSLLLPYIQDEETDRADSRQRDRQRSSDDPSGAHGGHSLYSRLPHWPQPRGGAHQTVAASIRIPITATMPCLSFYAVCPFRLQKYEQIPKHPSISPKNRKYHKMACPHFEILDLWCAVWLSGERQCKKY